MPRRTAIGLFLGAFAVRMAYIAGVRHLVWFPVPLVDGANYFGLARTVAAGHLLGGREAFWQPPLYPYFLAALFRVVGERMLPIVTVQAALGAMTCVLAASLGARLWGSRAGTAAGVIAALYGPLVHFDAQPLVPVVHVFLVTAGLLALARAAGLDAADAAGGAERRFAVAGLLWGLAAIATPNILLCVPATALWIAWTGRSAGALRRSLFWLAGLALPVLLVGARNLLVAGEPVLVSSNGGINLYIGNNPDYERTVRIRPGGEFERLAQEPENLGILGAAARSGWFAQRATAFWTGYPGPAARLFLRKARDLVAGREIPRNENLYEYRSASAVLALLVWRAGVSFPFGVVAPLALAGACLALSRRGPPGPRQGAILLALTAVSYAVSVLIFFPTDRYRLPLVPIAALFAGRLIAEPRALRRPLVAAALLGGLVLFNLDAATPTESYPEETALNRAYALRALGRGDDAQAEYERAFALNPRRLDAPNSLAVLAAERGDWEEAVTRYTQALAIDPGFVDLRRSLGEALLALGRREEARREWTTAVGLAPAAGLALADLALLDLEEGALQPAEDRALAAVRVRPDLGETHMALALVSRALRRRDRALASFEEAARLFPEGSTGQARAREWLDRMRRRGSGEPAAPAGGP
ncbi:MAG TPA: tetratricopeptide repeat protein [Candidatus Polarisedimenticolia bacterium]|nr:tetratricopeptide repeat protein [Candidatus Polarisedimenticolia bacterium]